MEVFCCACGCVCVCRSALRSSIRSLLWTSVVLCLLLLLLFGPPYVILSLLEEFDIAHSDNVEWWRSHLSPWRWIMQSSTVAPSALLFLYTQILGYEECFFAMMTPESMASEAEESKKDKQTEEKDGKKEKSEEETIALLVPGSDEDIGRSLEHALRIRPRPSFFASARGYLARVAPLVLMGLCVTAIQSIPGVHAYVPSLWLLKLAAKLGFLKRKTRLLVRIAIIGVLAAIIYSHTLRLLCYEALHVYMATMSLSRELFDTYLSRLDAKETKKSDEEENEDDTQEMSTLRSTTTNNTKSSVSPTTDAAVPADPSIDASVSDAVEFHQPEADLYEDPADDWEELPATRSSSQMIKRKAGGGSVVSSAGHRLMPSSSMLLSMPPLPHTSARSFLSAHSALLAGVGVVFVIPFKLSALVGIVLAPIAHAAAANVLLYAVQQQGWRATGGRAARNG